MRRCFRSVVQTELPEAPVHCLFFPPRAPEGAGNYLVACQRAAVIAVCVIRMAAVNTDARASVAVGGQVLVLIKCVSRNHLCVSVQSLPVRVRLCPAQRGAHAVKVKGRTTDRVGGSPVVEGRITVQQCPPVLPVCVSVRVSACLSFLIIPWRL